MSLPHKCARSARRVPARHRRTCTIYGLALRLSPLNDRTLVHWDHDPTQKAPKRSDSNMIDFKGLNKYIVEQ